jgi:hypothetical protein
MPAGARPAGGPNPKRPAARRRRSADGASRAAPGRPPRHRARPAHAHGLASTATLCGGIGTVGALWILLALLGFLPTVGGTKTPCALSHTRSSACAFRATGSPQLDILAYQRDTYTNVTGRDLQLEAGRTTSLFKTMTETLDLARTNIASGVKEDDLKPIKDLLKMADRSPTDVAQTYMHDPAMTNTTALTKGTSYLRKYVLKATEHSGRFVLNDSARTRPSSWRRCDDVLDYIWRQKMLLQDKTSKIEKLQQLLHSERQRTELPIGAVLVCVFLLSFLKALRDWLLPRIHGEVQGVPVRAIRGVAVPAARLVRVPVVVDAETVDNFTACLLRSLTERELRERFLGGQWSTIHNASNIVYQRDRCESCGSGLFN